MRQSLERLPGLQLVKKKDLLPEDALSTSKLSGYAQFPSPLRGSVFHYSSKRNNEIDRLAEVKELTEAQIKAYMSEKKDELYNRGSITHMRRDARPDYPHYRHIKVKKTIVKRKDDSIEEHGAVDLVENSNSS